MRKSIKSSSKAQDTEKEKHQQLTTREGDALLTAGEGDALRSYLSGLDKETAPTINFSEDGSKISIGHPDQKMGFLLLTAAFGATNPDFAMDIILELMEASREGSQFNRTKFNSLLAMVISRKPHNEAEARLALNMAITNRAIMKTARQMAGAPNMMQQESAQRMFSKLNHTFHEQLAAFDRGRHAAENTVMVQQNFNVADGGRAAVLTNVTNVQPASAEAQNESPAASLPAIPDARATPMPVIEESKEPVEDSKQPAVIPKPVQRFRPKLVK